MNTKLKKQIKQLLASLRKNVQQESKAGVDQLERLFGELRREMADIKSQLESAQESKGSLVKKADELSNSLGLEKRKSIETQKSLQQRIAELARLQTLIELLTLMASGVTDALLIDSGIEFESPGEIHSSEDVHRLMSRDPFYYLLAMLAVIKTTAEFLNENAPCDGFNLKYFSALNLCIVVQWSEDEELVVRLDTFESLRSRALETGIKIDLESLNPHVAPFENWIATDKGEQSLCNQHYILKE
ncbi:hypothetical protein ACYFX5_20055 [Bremerella sp. T1]|uniref:hypothetical protein n=1 Tax=Bremerella sp. TYQ1 TaxID=3119568 RepID=UPI001CCB1AA6|nr:hypothetical protein [Bremerella volcania]UBM35337.1 hypothetical protein LA756_22000 [Bremerella volcania]